MGEKFHKREKRENSAIFLKNIALNGLFGSSNPEECHHPIKLTMPFIKIGNTQYYVEECRDCGKLFTIFKK
jgi:hypothetical protein